MSTLFSRTYKKFKKEARDIGEGANYLGMITSTIVGAGIGAVAGYFTEGPSKIGEYAVSGALIGFLVEMFFHPSAMIFLFKYTNSKIKGCEKPRSIYRTKTLSRLNELQLPFTQ